MLDLQGRNINKLRVSVSEACNMACSYCVTGIEDHQVAPDQLAMPDLLRLVELLHRHAGIEKIRITGGEPLLYRELIPFIEGLTQAGLEDIGLTSNGLLLAKSAPALASAGLKHINLSLDSLQPERFREMGRAGSLKSTLKGIDASLKAGLRLKINMVVMKGENDDELADMLEFGIKRGIEVRYLELMRMGPLYQNGDFKLVTMEEMLDQIAERFTITPAKADHDSTSKRFWVPGGYFGIIPNESAPFCSTCSRLRLTSNGKLVGCLSNPEETSIRHLLDEPNPEEKLKSLVLESVSYKQSSFTGSDLVMSKIGG